MTDSVLYTGFHYVDWQFDGPDNSSIIYAVCLHDATATSMMAPAMMYVWASMYLSVALPNC